MSTTGGILPTYQRFVNGVPVPSFSRRSFRPREKYLIFLVFLTFGLVCFGTFFFLPEFRGSNSTVDSVYKVYQHMQKAGPELLIPAPPHLSENSDSLKLIRHDDEQLDPHVIDDRAKLLAKIEQDNELKVLERPNMDLNLKPKLSSTSTVSRLAEDGIQDATSRDEGVVPQVVPVVTVPPAHSDHYPDTNRGEDRDPVARERRAKVKEVTVNDIAKPLLKWLDVVGCNPYNVNKFTLIRWFIATLWTSLVWIAIFIRMVIGLYDGITFETCENVTNFFLLFQFVFKYFFYRLKVPVLKQLFETTYNNFWATDSIFSEPKKFTYMYYIIYTTMALYRKSYIIMNFLYTIEPLLYRRGVMRIPIWIPNYEEIVKYSPYYELIYAFEVPVMLSADFVMLNFELMCLFFLGTSYVQIEMIKTKFQKIGRIENDGDLFRECVEHHNLILEDFSVGFCICSIINLINFYLYCLIGQYLYDQTVSISEALSSSDWWNIQDVSVRKSMIIVMERSSKGVKLTAGGLLDFTLDTFAQVLRVMLSTLQFLWSTTDRNSNE